MGVSARLSIGFGSRSERGHRFGKNLSVATGDSRGTQQEQKARHVWESMAGDAGLAPALVVRVAWKVSTLPLGIHLIDRKQDAKLDSDSGAEKTERLDGHSMIVLLQREGTGTSGFFSFHVSQI